MLSGRPGWPNRFGIQTVNPASRTKRAKRATCGVIPGISVITITAGPRPATNTSLVWPWSVIWRRSKSESASGSARFCSAISPPACRLGPGLVVEAVRPFVALHLDREGQQVAHVEAVELHHLVVLGGAVDDLDPRIARAGGLRTLEDRVERGGRRHRDAEVLQAPAAHRLRGRVQEHELLVAVAAQHQPLAVDGHGR